MSGTTSHIVLQIVLMYKARHDDDVKEPKTNIWQRICKKNIILKRSKHTPRAKKERFISVYRLVVLFVEKKRNFLTEKRKLRCFFAPLRTMYGKVPPWYLQHLCNSRTQSWSRERKKINLRARDLRKGRLKKIFQLNFLSPLLACPFHSWFMTCFRKLKAKHISDT